MLRIVLLLPACAAFAFTAPTQSWSSARVSRLQPSAFQTARSSPSGLRHRIPESTRRSSRRKVIVFGEQAPTAVVKKYAEYAPIREMGFDRAKLIKFFSKKPHVVAARLVTVTRTLNSLKKEWDRQEKWPAEDRTRGAIVRSKLSGLGPCFVKIGQTLSQRPDVVGEEACKELKLLQTENEPFDDEVAMHIMATELGWKGPVAPGVVPKGCLDPHGPPLFAEITHRPIASASLGQVYRARLDPKAARTAGLMSDGEADWEIDDPRLEVAVKVQRPEAVRQIALDWTCLALALEALEAYWRKTRPSGFTVSLGKIADEIASNLFQELNYRQEAKNSQTFKESLAFLGFVDVPQVVSSLTTPCVLTTSWVFGKHLRDLTVNEGLSLTSMAVEACTASLVLTGYVHADPHEGNLMLDEYSGRLVFLDFGLMSAVEPEIMEGFARGIQACLAEDYDALAVVFQDVGFVGRPLQWRPDESYPFEERPIEAFSAELRKAMMSNADGTSRFGALAEVLSRLGKQWRMYTPPYVLLLIRTFLTLEGIAAKVDPTFNIYAVSLPWAVKRSLSPSSPEGVASLRSTFLTEKNTLQLDRFQKLLTEAAASSSSSSSSSSTSGSDKKKPSTTDTTALTASASAQTDKAAAPLPVLASSSETASSLPAGATPARGMEAVAALLGSREGATLRSIAWDLDSTDLLLRLGSAEGRPLRRLAAKVLAARVADKLRAQNTKKYKLFQSKGLGSAAVAALPSAMTTTPAPTVSVEGLPVPPVATTVSAMAASLDSVSEEAKYKDVPAAESTKGQQPAAGQRTGVAMMPGFAAKEARRAAWASKMVQILVRKHIAKQLSAGWRGLWGACCLAWFLLRVTSEALVRGVGLVAADVLRQTFGRGGGRSFSAKEADDSDDALLEGSGDRRSEGTGANSDANPAWT